MCLKVGVAICRDCFFCRGSGCFFPHFWRTEISFDHDNLYFNQFLLFLIALKRLSSLLIAYLCLVVKDWWGGVFIWVKTIIVRPQKFIFVAVVRVRILVVHAAGGDGQSTLSNNNTIQTIQQTLQIASNILIEGTVSSCGFSRAFVRSLLIYSLLSLSLRCVAKQSGQYTIAGLQTQYLRVRCCLHAQTHWLYSPLPWTKIGSG